MEINEQQSTKWASFLPKSEAEHCFATLELCGVRTRFIYEKESGRVVSVSVLTRAINEETTKAINELAKMKITDPQVATYDERVVITWQQMNSWGRLRKHWWTISTFVNEKVPELCHDLNTANSTLPVKANWYGIK